MWPFSRAPTDPELKIQIRALAERQERLERVMRDIRLEWDEMYDKFRLLYARAAKRIRDAQEIEPAAHKPLESHEDDSGAPISQRAIPLGPRIPKRNY